MDQPIRVLTPFSGDSIGGSYISALTLVQTANRQNKVNYEIVIHQPGKLEDKLNELRLAYQTLNVSWVTLSGLSNLQKLILPLKWSLITLRLLIMLKKERYNAVHVHDGRMALTWTIACKLSGTPLIIHQRTKFSQSKITEFIYKKSRKIIAITRFVFNSMPSSLKEKSVIIDNPVDVPPRSRNISRKKIEREFSIREDSFVITVIGTHQQQKRQFFALLLANKIKKEHGTNAIFIFIGKEGDNKFESILNEIKELDLVEQCVVCGYVNSYDYLPGCDLLLAPAVDEGFGRTLIEALLYNVPVLAAASGGHLDILKNDAEDCLFQPDDLQDCFEKICRHIEGNAKLPTISDFSHQRHCTAITAETLKVVTQ